MYRIMLSACLAILVAAAIARPAFGSTPAATINAELLFTGFTNVDSDHNGKASVGDLTLAPGFYVNSGGKRMGKVSASCVQMNTAGTEFNCTDVHHFAGGDIVTAGRFSPLEKIAHQAIVGGTGVYAGVRGTLAAKWLARDFSLAAVTFTLNP